MAPQQLWAPAGTVLAVAIACAAVAWRDCMLMATSLVLAHRLFLLHMDRGAPWGELAAAVNAISAGVLTVGAGVLLLAGIATAWLGWWQPTTEHAVSSLLPLAAGSAWCCLSRGDCDQALQEFRPWLWLVGGTVLAAQAYEGGMTFAPCLLVSAVGVVMVWAGWRLATLTASGLLRAGSRSR